MPGDRYAATRPLDHLRSQAEQFARRHDTREAALSREKDAAFLGEPQPLREAREHARREFEQQLEAIPAPPQARATIGRVVHYYRPSVYFGHVPPAIDPEAAVICTAARDEFDTVRLHVLGRADDDAIVYNVPFSPTPKHGHWSWPPR